MLKAAAAEGRDITRISFKGTCQAIREWAPVLAAAPARDRQRLVDAMLKAIARTPLPSRPDRSEPRARKRRPKNFQLLNKPRSEFKECSHRGKYSKIQGGLS
jgi:hypothetical protein